ncbi:MAG: hypothetical protein JWN72_2886, partial [Thermoleophilia bacterium]|nr:hypothetical protein [Thermoleophilia bacterium]
VGLRRTRPHVHATRARRAARPGPETWCGATGGWRRARRRHHPQRSRSWAGSACDQGALRPIGSGQPAARCHRAAVRHAAHGAASRPFRQSAPSGRSGARSTADAWRRQPRLPPMALPSRGAGGHVVAGRRRRAWRCRKAASSPEHRRAPPRCCSGAGGWPHVPPQPADGSSATCHDARLACGS